MLQITKTCWHWEPQRRSSMPRHFLGHEFAMDCSVEMKLLPGLKTQCMSWCFAIALCRNKKGPDSNRLKGQPPQQSNAEECRIINHHWKRPMGRIEPQKYQTIAQWAVGDYDLIWPFRGCWNSLNIAHMYIHVVLALDYSSLSLPVYTIYCINGDALKPMSSQTKGTNLDVMPVT